MEEPTLRVHPKLGNRTEKSASDPSPRKNKQPCQHNKNKSTAAL
jgi:hypothetical protein